MASFFLLLLLLLLLLPFSNSAKIYTEFLYPNTTFTSFHYVDSDGVFLSSPNNTFYAAFRSNGPDQSFYYLSLFHTLTNNIVWSANPNSPVASSSSSFALSASSLSLLFSNGSTAWSTPPFSSPIHSLRLLDTGNLMILNSLNYTLWQSFDHPTNTLLPGQRLNVNSSITNSVSDTVLSYGDYSLIVTSSDATLKWRGVQQYWRMSSDPNSVKDSNAQIGYMVIESTGIYFMDSGGKKTVFQVSLSPIDGLWVGKLDSGGRFRIIRYGSTESNEFVVPRNDCDLPMVCISLGLCSPSSNGSTCSCPGLFGNSAHGGCSPADGSVLPSCDGSPSSNSVSYLGLGSSVGYFDNEFSTPVAVGEGFESCQTHCSTNCSCRGFFYRNSSQSCYLIQSQIGSLSKIGNEDVSSIPIGYIKTLKSSSPNNDHQRSSSPTDILPIILPLIATFLLLIVLSFVGFQWWRKRSKKNRILEEVKLGRSSDVYHDNGNDEVWIPGLPARFTYEDLAAATNDFRILIGSGGFGSVYKGSLPDKTLVAVKKITNIGVQGKREFCTEIAVIGKIHHVNLVKLRGYCAQGTNRLLVYEFMNRGSLDRSLFGVGPLLEWKERMQIAIGAGRGLAYLHTGCEHKIIHCDIKPENILLDDNNQVKIADFGMAKLMSPDQSGFFTTMRGTRGYLAPEWLTNSAISDRTDVYSYGMVLLEIVRGRKNRYATTGSVGSSGTDRLGGEDYFPMVAVERHVEGRWLELADPRMEGRVRLPEVERVVKVALCCLHEEPGLRPSMGAVVGMLEGTTAVWEPRVEALRFLRVYGRGEGSAVEMVGYCSESGTRTATETSGSSLTFMSSQQVSGPR